MDKSEILESLILSKDQTLQFFDLNEEVLEKSYGKEKWTIREILHHLTDSELIFHYRLKKIIAEPKPVIWAYDQDRWNVAFTYRHKPLTLKKQLFMLCRDLNIDLVNKFFDRYADRQFVHSVTGLGILGDEFARVSAHNFNHLGQIQKALDR